jgi:hypothetical protein
MKPAGSWRPPKHAALEKGFDHRCAIRACLHLQEIETAPSETPVHSLAVFQGADMEFMAKAGVSRIHFQLPAGLQVGKAVDAARRQVALPRIDHAHADQVMALPGQSQVRAVAPLIQKIRNEKNDGPLAVHPVQVQQCRVKVRAAPLGLKGKHLPHQAHAVLHSLARRKVALHPVGKEDEPHLVAAGHGGQAQQGAQLSRGLGLSDPPRTECRGSAGIDQKDHPLLPLFHITFHMEISRARRHVPVDAAHIIAGQVAAHLEELDTRALEGGLEAAGHAFGNPLLAADMDAPNLLNQFADVGFPGHGQGTSTRSKMRSTIWVEVISSASAS